MESTTGQTAALPGFGLPIDHTPEKRFPTAVDVYPQTSHLLPLTVRERNMLDMIEKITNKQDWNQKMLNGDITKKWLDEAFAGYGGNFTKTMFFQCMAELSDKAEWLDSFGFVPVLDSSTAVIKSDLAIPSDLHHALQEAVSPLENVPEKMKDWHPGSDGKVLDLVHPSMYPLMYGTSKAVQNPTMGLSDSLKHAGGGTVLSDPGAARQIYFSHEYQWLPCDVHFERDGEARIASYVNNLHPEEHGHLYPILNQYITKSIPLCNRVLSWKKCYERLRFDIKTCEYIPPEDPGSRKTDKADARSGDNDDDDDSNYSSVKKMTCYERMDWERENRILVQPEPVEYKPLDHSKFASKGLDLQRDYKDSGIQVIVKLANIHLTPDKPEYDGGNWHIEGLLNEHICAASLYYYDSENVTESYLSFRHRCDYDHLDSIAEQDDYEGVEKLFDIQQDGPIEQDVGKVLTPEGRLLVFPNALQHRVHPFRLADPTKPGHRKILALFLVDPHIRIISTANVPPQRQDWWRKAFETEGRLGALPKQIRDMIFDYVDFPMNLEDAKKVREKLMEERGPTAEAMIDDVETFNFCEH